MVSIQRGYIFAGIGLEIVPQSRKPMDSVVKSDLSP